MPRVVIDMPPSVIAERMIVSRPTMNGLLRTLERRGLTRRRLHPTDNRVVLIEMAPGGEAAVEMIRPRLHQAEKQVMFSLSPAGRERLLRLIARVQQSVARLDHAAPDDQPPDEMSPDERASDEVPARPPSRPGRAVLPEAGYARGLMF